MPAAAVIPAPIAYIKVVAGKKLVVGSLSLLGGSAQVVVTFTWRDILWLTFLLGALKQVPSKINQFYFEEIRVLKAGSPQRACPNTVAWNNGIGPRFYFVGLSEHSR